MLEGKDQELSCVHAEFGMSIRNPSGEVKYRVMYESGVEERNLCRRYEFRDSSLSLKP